MRNDSDGPEPRAIVLLRTQVGPQWSDPQFRAQFATLVIHYWANDCFLPPDGVLGAMATITDLPGVLIHGRYDVSGPLSVVDAVLADHAEAVVREAVSNAVRHSGGSTVSVGVTVDDNLTITVTPAEASAPAYKETVTLFNADVAWRATKKCGQ